MGTLFCAHADAISTKDVGTKAVPTLRSNIRFYLRVFAEKLFLFVRAYMATLSRSTDQAQLASYTHLPKSLIISLKYQQ